MSTQMNARSDAAAKEAFCNELRRRGYEHVRVTAAPADITAVLEGEEYLFEIKYTRATKHYFGAATLTEWLAAVKRAEYFRFVVASENERGWAFKEFTVEDFMAYSYVPPFKVYFNVPLEGTDLERRKPSRRVHLTHERLVAMEDLYRAFCGR